jgi:L-amino acid N-acyltransferase YncA
VGVIEIRPYREDDLEALRAIMNEIVARGDAFTYEAPFTPEAMRAYIESYSATFTAMGGRGVVGGYLLRPNQPGRGAHVCNATYMVGAAARGRGVGRLMGEHSLGEAKRMGFREMQFNAVVSTNAPAVELWKSLGFEVIGVSPRAFRMADGSFVDLYVMHRTLG